MTEEQPKILNDKFSKKENTFTIQHIFNMSFDSKMGAIVEIINNLKKINPDKPLMFLNNNCIYFENDTNITLKCRNEINEKNVVLSFSVSSFEFIKNSLMFYPYSSNNGQILVDYSIETLDNYLLSYDNYGLAHLLFQIFSKSTETTMIPLNKIKEMYEINKNNLIFGCGDDSYKKECSNKGLAQYYNMLLIYHLMIIKSFNITHINGIPDYACIIGDFNSCSLSYPEINNKFKLIKNNISNSESFEIKNHLREKFLNSGLNDKQFNSIYDLIASLIKYNHLFRPNYNDILNQISNIKKLN